MDKARQLAKRPSKAKALPSGDFIALGGKSDAKASGSSQSRKLPPPSRDFPSSSLSKKPKLSISSLTPLGRSDVDRRASPITTQVYLYEQIARDVASEEFLESVIEADDQDDDEGAEALMCGAVKHLRANRAKPDHGLYLGLMYLAKTRSSCFQSETIVEAMCSLLKRDISMNFKAKGNPLVTVLACNTLMSAFHEEEVWPDAFVKVYLEDSMGERVWVDRPECKTFVDNIQTAFNTKMPKVSHDQNKADRSPSAGASPIHVTEDDEQSMDVDHIKPSFFDQEVLASMVVPRYTYQQTTIETYVLDVIREQLNKRQSMDGTSRNMLRLMMATSGYSEVRLMAIQRLEMWLQNPKVNFYKNAQDLLLAVCMNCDQHSTQDIEVISSLCKIRLKNVRLNHYLMCVRELIEQHTDNLHTLMTHAVYNELSQSRNPNNMALLSTVFAQDGDRAAKSLALIFQELLANKEDYLRAVRTLFREIVRAVRNDMSFTEFAMGLIEEKNNAKFKELETQHKERLLFSLTDMICLTIIMSVSPSIREAAASSARGQPKDLEALRTFQQKVAIIQRDAVWWIHTVVPNMFNAAPKEYVVSLRKVLFLDSAEHYHKVDNWPPEGDRAVLVRLVSEVPVLEDTLMRVLVIGLTRELRVNPSDCMDIAEHIVHRAAQLYSTEGVPVLQVERLELIDALFHLATYKHPDNIQLPKGYTPPRMAIVTLYWKAWSILLIISAFNTSTFGEAAWDNYPTLRYMMEMVMTNNFKFPPPTQVTEEQTADDVKAKERQACELDKQSILEFEGHLAAATRKEPITESNSLLVSLLMNLAPSDLARRPPNEFLEQLKALNIQLKIGQLLCRSRSPNFLMDIIKRQGTSESMPWLANLVDGSEESMNLLPVQCLCEFLLMDHPQDVASDETDAECKPKTKGKKQELLLSRLQSLMHSPTSDNTTVIDVLEYFLQRLSSQQTLPRQQALKGLLLVLSKSHMEMSHFDVDSEDDDDVIMEETGSEATRTLPGHRWLLEQLPALTQFGDVKQQVCQALRKAIQVESDASTVSAYVIFLSQHTLTAALHTMDELLLDLAQLIVERSTLMNHILPQEDGDGGDKRGNLVLSSMVDLFYAYLKKAQQPQETYSWSNTQDQILLQWSGGASATMNILVVHAMVILLTYGKPSVTSSFEALLECWFPADANSPSAFLVDTSEEALLLPDWLKLRMIRSVNQRLVDASLQDIEPSQLLLFVQSFGIPVESMSKLLGYLDKACDVDSAVMEQVVVDKTYMCQLLEVQHMRGATGGHTFMTMLKQAQPKEDDVTDVVMTSAARVRRTESQLLRTQEIPPFVCKDSKQMMDVLNKMFSATVAATERSQLYRSLQKTLSHGVYEELVIAAMAKILNKSSADQFVNGLKKNIHLSCPLIRMLAAKKPSPPQLVPMLQRLNAILHPSKSALATLIKHLLDTFMATTHAHKLNAHLQKVRRGQVSVSDGITQAVTSDVGGHDTEALVNKCVSDVLNNSAKTRDVVDTLTQLLISSVQGNTQQLHSGLLVDWLSLLDPDVIAVSPMLQTQLLFNASKPEISQNPATGTTTHVNNIEHDRSKLNDSGISNMDIETSLDRLDLGPRDGQCQQYLLSLVVHQASWHSRQQCVQMLLSDRSCVKRHDASRALDFLWATLHIPKIWQGRDKNLPKNFTPEDVLALTPEQLKIIVQYVLHEAVMVSKTKSPTSTHQHNASEQIGTSTQLSTEAQQVLMKRTRLLRLCCCGKSRLIRVMVQELSQVIRSKGALTKVAQHLLFDIYVNMPSVINGLNEDITLIQDIPASYHTLSQLDTLSHRVINTLNDPAAGKKYECKMYDANIACRKFASEHPMLILRQLPLLAALLQGRANYRWGELKHRNHLLLYTHVLGILELLQPYLFHTKYADPFSHVLEAFFQLMRMHSLENRQLASVVTKFVKLLHNLQTCDANQAVVMLHKYVPVLDDLSRVFPDLAPLRSLLAGLVVPKQCHDAIEGQETPADTPPPPLRPTSPWPTSQLTPFLKKLCSNDTEDVLQVLQDLDETSKRKVEIIQYFTSDLKRLMQDSHEQCRNTAFNLVMRHIRQNPSCAGDIVSTFEQCLDSPNHQVVMSALKNLAEFTLLAQEYAVVLLQKAFTVGITYNVETKSYLTEALQLLNMETMH